MGIRRCCLGIETGQADLPKLHISTYRIKGLSLLNLADVTDQAGSIKDHLLATDLQGDTTIHRILHSKERLMKVQVALKAGTCLDD